MSKFIHITNWGSSCHETWVPVVGNGNYIPHIYGYLVSAKDAQGYTQVDVSSSDLYELEETQKRHIGLIGSATTGHPTGKFKKVANSHVNAKIYYSTYCDMGCHDCGHEYEHADLIPHVISGCFAVPKGSKVAKLVCVNGGGASKHEKTYKLVGP